MNEDQIRHWFTYHAPTDENIKDYDEIREAVKKCEVGIARVFRSTDQFKDRQVPFSIIGDACLRLALTINKVCPDSADKTAAIRCVRLSRMAANEALLLTYNGVQETQPLAFNEALRQFTSELQKARWQANAAIACHREIEVQVKKPLRDQ